MFGVNKIFVLPAALWRGVPNLVCLFYKEGRKSLLQRAKATTDLQKLAVRKQEIDIAFQQANRMIDLMNKVDRINDPVMREEIRKAFMASCGALSRPYGLPRRREN
jgi:hypothetical protein